MARKPLPEGFKKAFRGLIAQGWKPKDAMREAWRVYRGDAPGMKREPLKRRKNPIYKKYAGREGESNFRAMTLDEAKGLQSGSHIWFVSIQGDARRAKVNGKVKRWKREPDRIEIPIKYGMYEFATFNERDVLQGRLLIETELNPISHKAALGHAKALVKHEKESVKKNPRTGREQLTGKVNFINQALGTDFRINRAYGGLRIEAKGGSIDVSPRLTPKEMLFWLDAFITALEWVDRSKTYRNPRKRNPIAVYNPPRQRLPIKNVTISYQRAGGEYSGEWFKHPFKSSVDVYGLSDGSVLIKSKGEKRLWGEA